MKKIKCNEIVKVVTATALSIGLFNASFMGVNYVAFAAAANTTMTMPLVGVTANIQPDINAVPENYSNPVITVFETTNERSQTKSANALTAEQAAEIGARYIWEVLDENIDGRTVYMSYDYPLSSTRVHWIGSVLAGSDRRDLLEFAIDAVSGERIYIRDYRRDAALPEKFLTAEESRNWDSNRTPYDLEEYMQLAKEYAQKHFNFTEVVGAEYNGMRPAYETGERRLEIISDLIRNTISVSYRETMLDFTVTDETGRMAIMSISMETKRLFHLSTQRNDIVPGYDLRRGNIPAQEFRNNERDRNDTSGGINYGDGITPEEVEIIRNDPTHPRYNELFGRISEVPKQ